MAARSISRALEPPACTEKEIRLIRLITQKLLNQLNGNKLKIFMLYEKHVIIYDPPLGTGKRKYCRYCKLIIFRPTYLQLVCDTQRHPADIFLVIKKYTPTSQLLTFGRRDILLERIILL